MAVLWTPPSGTLIIDASEEQVGVFADIVVESQPSATEPPVTEPIDHLDWSWSPDTPGNVVVTDTELTASSRRLRVLFPDFAGIFPPRRISYILGESRESVTRWVDLPAAARDVTEFLPHETNIYVWTLEVTAQPMNESAVYTIRVRANYSLGRDILVAEVNARRRA